MLLERQQISEVNERQGRCLRQYHGRLLISLAADLFWSQCDDIADDLFILFLFLI